MFRSPTFPFLGHRTEEYSLSDRQSTDASDRAVDSRGVLVRTNDRFSTAGAGLAESESRFTIKQRASRIVTVMAGASSAPPNEGTPLNHSSSWKGTNRSKRTTTFGQKEREKNLKGPPIPIQM